MTEKGLLPLEIYFKEQAKKVNEFPNKSTDYFVKYQAICDYLREHIYPNINVGLTVNSDDKAGDQVVKGLYTSHGEDHFDEVVNYAGQLLGINANVIDIGLGPFEVYALLVAIRIHDAGNILGRSGHNERCFDILSDMSSKVNLSTNEIQRIAKIAAAHGGKTRQGSKDTISTLKENHGIASSQLRERLVAAIVRFADEICENRNRASNYLMKKDKIPEHSLIYHKYGAAINNNSVNNGVYTIDFILQIDDLKNKYMFDEIIENGEIFLIDYIYTRLEKMNLERVYCNKFMGVLCPVNAIKASISVQDNFGDDLIEPIAIDLNDIGYPSIDEAHPNLQKCKDTLNGEAVLRQIEGESNGQ